MSSKTNRIERALSLSLVGLLFVIAFASPGSSEEKYRPVRSNDIINRTQGGYKEAQKSYVKIQQAIVNEDYETATDLARDLVDQTPMNLDAKVLYAEILYKRYSMNPSDASIKNKCIKMWLIIHRLIKDDGWTLSDKSLHTPFKYRFHTSERRDLVSVARLKELCGRPPKWHESNQKYLKKFLLEEKTVDGKIVHYPKPGGKTR